MRIAIALCTALFVAACGGDDGAASDGGGSGGRDGGGTLGGLGDPCVRTADCMPDLYCSGVRACAASGTGVDGEACVTTADCARGNTCVREPEGWVCRPAGDRDIGEPCLRHEQCQAGLFCHMGRCTGEVPDAGTGGFDGGATVCTPGTDDCDDGSDCTTDQCIADMCVYTLIDSDMDGYASTVIGPCGDDCADMDEGAHPGQEEHAGERHEGGPGQTRSFDWNCDGIEEKRYPTAVTCSADTCDGGEGWLDSVPACGAAGRWGRCTSTIGCSEEVLEESRQQTCR